MILQIILLLIEELEKNEKFKLKLNMGMAIQMIIIIILIWIIIMVINCIGRLINEKNLNNRFYPELTIPIMYSNNEVEDGMSISTRIPIPIPMGWQL